MNPFQALRRLEAWKEGRPVPRGATLHFPLADDEETLVLALVKMGGETAPWGIAWGRPGGEPEVRVVPEPRDRDAVAGMVTELAPALLSHLFHPEFSDLEIFEAKQQRPLRQLWLPNASHVEMLHHLAYAFTFAKKGEPERVALLNAAGRAAGWLFREFNRPGQVFVMAATNALKESFVFPCEDLRQGHLGYLLAWMETRGKRETRLAAAAAAERRSISTALAPALEKEELADRVERYGEARREARKGEERRLAKEIAATLEVELRHRFDLTVEAIGRLRADRKPRNAGVEKLIAEGWESQYRDYLRRERLLADDPGGAVFVPSPETDRDPAWAARNYFTQQGCEERRATLLLADDLEMQAEAVASGDAVQGTIRKVRDAGLGRVTIPVWEVETDDEAPTKLRKDKDVFVASLPGRKGRVVDVGLRSGRTVFTIEITGLKTVPRMNVGGTVMPATDGRLVGERVVLLPATAEGIHARKRRKLGEKGAPGAWLTDARPTGKRSRIPAEVAGPLDAPVESEGEEP